ncbi:MAG: DNA adenine methylase [Thaumarchaeota archaeon]|nr:DNA adenine methylase [Nitrososphaerota archaeon]
MGLNYIGSKHTLLDFIDKSVSKVVDKKNAKTFCDLFAGSGVVGEYFKKQGYSVISNDIQYYSYVINKNRIANHKPLEFKGLITEIPRLKYDKDKMQVVCDYLNGLPAVRGFIYKNYSTGGSNRMYFTETNSMICDAIRQQITKWQSQHQINAKEYWFLLCSLLESIDKYANTASLYGAFLKQIKKSANKKYILQPSHFAHNKQTHKIYRQDANKLAKIIKPDIVYLDPPYNHRQYSDNYHLLETIALYDNPKIKGITGMREDRYKSLYCSRAKVLATFKDLIKNINAKYIFLSYNNEGLLTHHQIENVMGSKGQYGVFSKTYKRYKADSQRYNKSNITKEYLHYTICQ